MPSSARSPKSSARRNAVESAALPVAVEPCFGLQSCFTPEGGEQSVRIVGQKILAISLERSENGPSCHLTSFNGGVQLAARESSVTLVVTCFNGNTLRPCGLGGSRRLAVVTARQHGSRPSPQGRSVFPLEGSHHKRDPGSRAAS